jgi:hypothetical protein
MGSQDTFQQSNPLCFPAKTSDFQLSCIYDTYPVHLTLPELTALVLCPFDKIGYANL